MEPSTGQSPRTFEAICSTYPRDLNISDVMSLSSSASAETMAEAKTINEDAQYCEINRNPINEVYDAITRPASRTSFTSDTSDWVQEDGITDAEKVSDLADELKMAREQMEADARCIATLTKDLEDERSRSQRDLALEVYEKNLKTAIAQHHQRCANQKIVELRHEVKRSKQEAEALKVANSCLTNTIADAQTDNSELRKALHEEGLLIQFHIKENEKLAELIAERSEIKTVVQEELFALRIKSDKDDDKIAEMKHAASENHQVILELRERITNNNLAHAKVKAFLEDKMNDKESKISELQDKIAHQNKTHKANLDCVSRAHEVAIQALRRPIDEGVVEKGDIKFEIDELKAAFKKTNDDLKLQVREYRKDLEVAVWKHNMFGTERQANLQVILNVAYKCDDKIVALYQEIKTLQSQLLKCTNLKNEAEARHEGVVAQNVHKEEEVTRLNSKVDEHKTTIQNLTQTILGLQETVAVQSKSLCSLRKDLAATEAKENFNRAHLKRIANMHITLQQTHKEELHAKAALVSALNASKEAHTREITEMEEKHTREIEQISTDKEWLEEWYDSHQDDPIDTFYNFRCYESQCQADVLQAEAEVEELKTEVMGLKAEAADLVAFVDSLDH